MSKSLSKTPAPAKDRISGSKINPKGSASSEKSASQIKFDAKTLVGLNNKLKEFKEKHPSKKNITLSDLKAVYRRGAGAYSTSYRPTISGGKPNSRNAWAMARVNKFLLKAGGTKVKKAYVQDDDLMKYGNGAIIENEFDEILKSFYHDLTNNQIFNYLGLKNGDYTLGDNEFVIFRDENFTNVEKIKFGRFIESYFMHYQIVGKNIIIKLKDMYADGGDMSNNLAPNGKPSNLTPEQYKLVRTPEFKSWFGDWENDPENASKVLDKNGEPLVVYRGMAEESSKKYIFNYNYYQIKQSDRRNKFGFYFTDSYLVAKGYAIDSSKMKIIGKVKKIYNAYGTIEEFEEDAKSKSVVKSYFIDIKKYLDLRGNDSLSYVEFLNILNVSETEIQKFIEKYFLLHEKKYAYEKRVVYDLFITQKDKGIDIEDSIGVYFKNKILEKYDGVVFEETTFEKSDVYVAFEPTQIKLADGSNTTFNGANPDIRYAKGGLILYKEYSGKDVKKHLEKADFEHTEFLDDINDKDTYTLKEVEINRLLERDRTLKSFVNDTKGDFEGDKYIQWHRKYPIVIGDSDWEKNIVLDGYHRIAQANANGEGKIVAFVKNETEYADGGDVGQDITCRRCRHEWNTSQSEKHDKYVCHNCGFDNTSYYDSDVFGYKDGGEMDDNNETYKKWRSLVNMSYGEIKKFYDSKEGKEAGLSSSEAKKQGIDSGRESARMLMKMKTTPKTKWTPDMWRWAKKQISFISRMSGNQGGLYDDKGNKTRKHTSLLIWGNNPEKKSSMKYEKGGAVIPQQGTLFTKDKKSKLEYYKKGNDYAFKVYDVENNPVQRGRDEVLMTYDQFINYLYSELYIDDKYENGGATDNSVINEILERVKPYQDEMAEKWFEKVIKDGKIKITEEDKDLYKRHLVVDLIKAVGNYVIDGDKLKSISMYRSRADLVTINSIIIRGDKEYKFSTDVIYAGGYNIQKLHIRYIVNTDLPYAKSNNYYEKVNNEYKALTKIQKLKQDISSEERIVENLEERLEKEKKLAQLSDEQIEKNLREEDPSYWKTIDTTWDEIVKRGADKNYDYDENLFKREMEQSRKSRIRFFREIKANTKQTQQFIDSRKKEINKLKKKISDLESIKYEDGGVADVRMEDTVQRMDDPNFADISFYRNGGKINYSEYYKKGGSTKTCEIFDKNGERRIDRESIEKLTTCVNNLPQTKEFHVNKKGEYSKERKELHKKIIYDIKKDLVCVENKNPIAILMGGSPASGKSTFLKKYRPYLLKNEILKIDADEIRSKLPEYKGYNATQTHLETKDIVNLLLSDRNIGIPCLFDLIYDGTMNNTKSYLPLIKLLKSLGYKVYVVYVDKVPKQEIVNRALLRYKKSGRFVPLEVIDDFFDKGKTALNQIKEEVDGYMIVDGSNSDYKVEEKGGIQLPKNRRYSNLGKPITITTEDVVREYKKGGELDPDNPTIKNQIVHKSGEVGGMLVGKRHSEGGIKAFNKSTGQPLEMEGGEVVITRNAVSDEKKRMFEGKMMTNREILSKINQSGGGVSFAEGGKVQEEDCGCNHYDAGGKVTTDKRTIMKMKELYPNDFEKGMNEESREHHGTFKDLRKGKISIKSALQNVVSEHLKSKPNYYKNYEEGGILTIGMKQIPSFKEFVRLANPIKSPYDGDNYFFYKINNDGYYYKDGNKNSVKISNLFAYETYLYDNFSMVFSQLPSKIKNALTLGKQSLIDNYINS